MNLLFGATTIVHTTIFDASTNNVLLDDFNKDTVKVIKQGY
jgi:hypothetical protein